jgi:hypothetical protein
VDNKLAKYNNSVFALPLNAFVPESTRVYQAILRDLEAGQLKKVRVRAIEKARH